VSFSAVLDANTLDPFSLRDILLHLAELELHTPLDLHDLDPVAVRAALEQQAADLNPPWPLDQLVAALEVAGVPRFAAAVRTARP
jgi:hypothetical protein